MNNTLFNFSTIAFGDVAVKDYAFQTKTSKLEDLPESNSNEYIEYIKFDNNQTFEMVSYILYDTSDYWDLLAALNNKDPLFDLAFAEDVLVNLADSKARLYEERVSEQKLDPNVFLRLKDRLADEIIDINDNNRIIKIIRINKLKDFLKILRDNDII